jgi:hypothetical protein
MSPSASAPEQRVAQRVDRHVAVGMRLHAALEGNAHAAEHEMVALAEGVHVETAADAQVMRASSGIRFRIDSASASPPAWSPDVVFRALDQARLEAERLHRHRLVGDRRAAAHRRLQGAIRPAAAEQLRGQRAPQLLARLGRGDALTPRPCSLRLSVSRTGAAGSRRSDRPGRSRAGA